MTGLLFYDERELIADPTPDRSRSRPARHNSFARPSLRRTMAIGARQLGRAARLLPFARPGSTRLLPPKAMKSSPRNSLTSKEPKPGGCHFSDSSPLVTNACFMTPWYADSFTINPPKRAQCCKRQLDSSPTRTSRTCLPQPCPAPGHRAVAVPGQKSPQIAGVAAFRRPPGERGAHRASRCEPARGRRDSPLVRSPLPTSGRAARADAATEPKRGDSLRSRDSFGAHFPARPKST